MQRRELIRALATLLLPPCAHAQQAAAVRRIGFLAARGRPTAARPDPYYSAFESGMRELRYTDGKNLHIEWRYAEGKYERLKGLAEELCALNPELIVTHSTRATEELLRATRTIPIVTVTSDPVASGFVQSLRRPGGNLTGLSIIVMDTSAKQLELLKTMMPKLTRAAVLVNPDNSLHPAIVKNLQAVSAQLKVSIETIEARTLQDIARGFAALGRAKGVTAVIVASDGFFVGEGKAIAASAMKERLATLFHTRELVLAGGLMSYGQNVADAYRRAAYYADKILKGAKPGELPIEQPLKVELVINRKAAAALGLQVPKELLLRADEVIE